MFKSPSTWLCFFEQSNTFRDSLRRHGFDSASYDNAKRGKQDYTMDLFELIEVSYSKMCRLEDNWFSALEGAEIGIIAFFPCVRFSTQANLYVSCSAPQYDKLKTADKFVLSSSHFDEVSYFYSVLCELCALCSHYGIPLIVENPYKNNMLLRYFPMVPSVVVPDRSLHGDWFVKPTMFYFIGLPCVEKIVFKPKVLNTKKVVEEHGIGRSLMSPDFADWFVEAYLV